MKTKNTFSRVFSVTIFGAITLSLLHIYSNIIRQSQLDKFSFGPVSFYSEPNYTLDVIFIGSSSTSEFINPYILWDEYGITSFDYATVSMPEEFTASIINELCQSQSPQIIIVDIRMLLEDLETEKQPRIVSISMDEGINRITAILKYSHYNNLDIHSELGLLFPLVSERTSYQALANPSIYNYWDNRVTKEDYNVEVCQKGYVPMIGGALYDSPQFAITDKCYPISAANRNAILDTIHECQQKNISLIYYVPPAITYSEKECMKVNYISNLLQENNITLWNLNYCFFDIGLDSQMDFYDTLHVNILGADKVTSYIGQLLSSNYELVDHRLDPHYSYWNDDYYYANIIYEKDRQSTLQLKNDLL